MSLKSENIELIEKYLRDELSSAEKSELEMKMKEDPLLKEEMQVQKEIIHGIKKYRHAELKSRLNSIKIYPWTGLINFPVAATITVTSLIAIGSYFYFSSPSTNTYRETDNSITTPSKPSSEDNEIVIDSVKAVEPASPDLTDSETNVITETKEIKKNKKPSPSVVIPITSNGAGNKNNISDTGTLASNKENGQNKNYGFHYQYFNNKLYLYGDFDEMPYEILELPTSKGKSLFMYYNNAFYFIKYDQKEIAPLEQVKNAKLLKELNELKDKK